MSDLVRREDVLDLVSMAREDWLDVPSVQSACGRLANRIGNIPAIGTCATCAEWRRVNHRDEVWGDCTNADLPWANKGYDFHPDFFCAAWRAKQ